METPIWRTVLKDIYQVLFMQTATRDYVQKNPTPCLRGITILGVYFRPFVMQIRLHLPIRLKTFRPLRLVDNRKVTAFPRHTKLLFLLHVTGTAY